jgi:NAD(P) transhydrogenase
MLKLLFHQDSRQLLGVHAIGQAPPELIHIGQMVMPFQGTIDHYIENINYLTLAECYQVAALNGYNKVMASR